MILLFECFCRGGLAGLSNPKTNEHSETLFVCNLCPAWFLSCHYPFVYNVIFLSEHVFVDTVHRLSSFDWGRWIFAIPPPPRPFSSLRTLLSDKKVFLVDLPLVLLLFSVIFLVRQFFVRFQSRSKIDSSPETRSLSLSRRQTKREANRKRSHSDLLFHVDPAWGFFFSSILRVGCNYQVFFFKILRTSTGLYRKRQSVCLWGAFFWHGGPKAKIEHQ